MNKIWRCACGNCARLLELRDDTLCIHDPEGISVCADLHDTERVRLPEDSELLVLNDDWNELSIVLPTTVTSTLVARQKGG